YIGPKDDHMRHRCSTTSVKDRQRHPIWNHTCYVIQDHFSDTFAIELDMDYKDMYDIMNSIGYCKENLITLFRKNLQNDVKSTGELQFDKVLHFGSFGFPGVKVDLHAEFKFWFSLK